MSDCRADGFGSCTHVRPENKIKHGSSLKQTRENTKWSLVGHFEVFRLVPL